MTGAVTGTLGTTGTVAVGIFIVLLLGGLGFMSFRRRKANK